jgi:hypothetical protein
MACVLALVTCGCGSSADSSDVLPLAEPAVSADGTGPTDDLAPSQITADTVQPPATPGPCELGDLEFWTAQVQVGESSADAVIRVRNVGDVWCEPDISGSPQIDPAIEPDVWLDPGGWADLVVGPSGRRCYSPEILQLAEIDIHGETVDVPTAAVATCGWQLTAFYPNEVAEQPCDQLEVVDAEQFVLVRNVSPWSCVLGELIGVDGNGASTRPRTDFDVPAIVDLAPGDVIGFVHVFDPVDDCDAGPSPGTMAFDVAGSVPVDEVVCGAIYEVGAGRPWYGDPAGPLAAPLDDPLDLELALAELDPF